MPIYSVTFCTLNENFSTGLDFQEQSITYHHCITEISHLGKITDRWKIYYN